MLPLADVLKEGARGSNLEYNLNKTPLAGKSPVARDDQRTRHLRIRLTGSEADAIEAAARAGSVRVSDQVRAMLFDGAGRIPAPAPARDAANLAEADRLRELKRIGVNINQLARQLNAGGDAAADDLGRVLETLRAWIGDETASRRRRQ